MRRKLKPFYKNYREVLVGGFIVLGVLVAILGTYQVYAPSFSDRPLKLFTVVLYDTIRLLLFSFRIRITEPTPLLYEIAVWLAPFTMLVTIFAVLRRTSQKVRLFAKYLVRGRLPSAWCQPTGVRTTPNTQRTGSFIESSLHWHGQK